MGRDGMGRDGMGRNGMGWDGDTRITPSRPAAPAKGRSQFSPGRQARERIRKDSTSAKGASQIPGIMPQSFASVTLQIVFSTKDRMPLLTDVWASRVHAYLATVCRESTGVVYAVGGVEDHVHIATVLPRTLTVADLVEKLKVASSHWIKTLDPGLGGFHWQRGYGAFSTGPTGKQAMIAYVQNQVEHHKGAEGRQGKTFQEEYRSLLRKYECEWDERYVWD
jgi:putative transposase